MFFALCCSTLCPSGMVFWNDVVQILPSETVLYLDPYQPQAKPTALIIPTAPQYENNSAKLKPTKLDVSNLGTGFLGATSKHP